MKRVLEVYWLHVKIFFVLAVAAGCSLLAWRTIYNLWLASQIFWYDPLWRAFVVMRVAHIRAGDPIPFSPDYGRTSGHIMEWGMDSNSNWLLDNTRMIIPYFSYEGINASPLYPKVVAFAPFIADRSFHVAGTYQRSSAVVLLNERIVLSKTDIWNDESDALATLVHELVHHQGGAFLSGIPEDLESATSAATLEVLAAMCNHNDTRACRAFWIDIESKFRALLRVEFHERGLGWLYRPLMNFLFLSKNQEIYAEKSNRYWEDNPVELMYILRAYSIKPLEDYIKPGVACGKALNTVDYTTNALWFFYPAGATMEFDDTAYLLRGMLWLFFTPQCLD